MTDFEAQVLGDLSALKSQMHALLGVGQPGRIHELEDRVARHERTVQRMKGIGTAFGVLMTIAHLLLDIARHH